MKRGCLILFAGLLASVSMMVLADAPVVDLSQSDRTTQSADQNQGTEGNQDADVDSGSTQDTYSSSDQSLSLDQRVTKLQNQMDNLANMNLPGKIADLQQQLQQLQGQMQVEQHDLKTLDEQQRNFYQDLDQRLNDLKTLVEKGVPPSSSTTPPSDATDISTPTNTTDTSTSSGNDELKAYQAAFKFISSKEYDKAVDSLQNFLKKYPNGTYAVNAHYWLGEIYYLQTKKDQASQEFQTVINDYPTSSKVSDAMLKYGYILRDQGNSAAAQSEFKKIIKTYPSTSAARLAKLQLNPQLDMSSAADDS